MEEKIASTFNKISMRMEESFGNIEEEQTQQYKEQEIECFKICLRERLCESFGLIHQNTHSICILRTSMPSRYTTLEGSSEFDLGCHIGNKQKFCQTFKSPLDELLTLENRKSIDETMMNLEKLSGLTQSEKSNRTRRSAVLGALFGGIIGTLTGGFSLYETYKLKSHVKQIQNQFEEFRKDVIMFETESVKFHQNVLSIYKRLQTKMDEGFSKLDCNIRNVAYHMMVGKRFLEWKAFIDVMAKDLIGGNLIGPVSPILLNDSDIRKLLQDPMFAETVYQHNIPLFYRLSKMLIVDIKKDEGMFNIHIVITVPNVKSKKVYTTYNTASVGMVNNGTCSNINLPPLVYGKEERYYKIDSSYNCEFRNNIRLCLSNQHQEEINKEVECLSENHRTCEIISEKCETKIIQTSGGIMVRSVNNIKASNKSNKANYIDVSTKPITKFLNYRDFYHISVDNRIIMALEDPVMVKELDIENEDDWQSYLNEKLINLKTVNIDILNESIQKQKEAIHDLENSKININTTKIFSISNMIMCILGIS